MHRILKLYENTDITFKFHVFWLNLIIFSFIYSLILDDFSSMIDKNNINISKKTYSRSFFPKLKNTIFKFIVGLYISCMSQSTVGFGHIYPTTLLSKLLIMIQILFMFLIIFL